MSYDMFHPIAAVACVAAGTLFVTVFGITGITAERDYVSSHRGAGCVKGVVEVDGGQCGAIPWRFGCGKNPFSSIFPSRSVRVISKT